MAGLLVRVFKHARAWFMTIFEVSRAWILPPDIHHIRSSGDNIMAVVTPRKARLFNVMSSTRERFR